jgi:hypothetical protein
MNTEKRIEQCLRAAPKPSVPDGLLNRLQEDVTTGKLKKRVTVLRRWLAPAGGSISLWRVAAAAVIAMAVLLPLSYGATKAVQHFIIEATFEYPQDDGGVHVYAMRGGFASSDPDATEEDARKAQQEFYELYKQGKAKEVEPDFWFAILSNGQGFGMRNPEMLGLSEAEQENLLKKQSDEIEELRKAGKFKRTFIKEIEQNGVTIRLYEDSFTLSNGKVITMGTGEPVQKEDE